MYQHDSATAERLIDYEMFNWLCCCLCSGGRDALIDGWNENYLINANANMQMISRLSQVACGLRIRSTQLSRGHGETSNPHSHLSDRWSLMTLIKYDACVVKVEEGQQSSEARESPVPEDQQVSSHASLSVLLLSCSSDTHTMF